jgi:hypothetical protein
MIYGNFRIGPPEVPGGILMEPIQIPEQYANLNNWLRAQGGQFRVLWLPYDREQFRYPWDNNGTIAQFSSFVSSRPSLYMFQGSGTETSRFLSYSYYNGLLENRTTDFGKIMSITNTKYFVYHNDYLDYEKLTSTCADDKVTVYSSLMGQKDVQALDLTAEGISEYINVFKNKYDSDPVFIPTGTILLTGGLEGYNFLSAIQKFEPRDWGILYSEQTPGLNPNCIPSSDILLFFNRDFKDLVLSLADKEHIIQLANPPATQDPYGNDTNGNPLWASFGISSADALSIWPYVDNGITSDVTSDLDFGQGYVLAFQEGAQLNTRFEVKNNEDYTIWLRILQHQNGGQVIVKIDDLPTMAINASDPQNSEFTWMNLGTHSLSQGEHTLSIVNKNGKNVVNVLSIIPTNDYTKLRQEATDLVEQFSGRIFYIFENEKPNTEQFTKSVFIPKNASYSLFVQGEVQDSLKVKVDEIPKDLSTITKTDSNWTYAGSLSLSSGERTLTFDLTDSTLNRVALFSSLDANKTSIDDFLSAAKTKASIVEYKFNEPTSITASVNASKPFLLVLAESYNPMWELDSNDASISSVPVYSFLDGFFVNKTGNFTVSISYKPQVILTFSQYVSVFSLSATVGFLGWQATKTILKKRKPKAASYV